MNGLTIHRGSGGAGGGAADGDGLTVASETVTTADPTVAVNQMHVLTIAGLTADRNFVLPSGTVDDRIGVFIVDGDATYEIICKGDTGVTINGGTAATEWSRVFIANECVIFRCTAANTWIVEYDGRIPCVGVLAQGTTGVNDLTSNTEVILDGTTMDTASIDVGDIVNTTSGKIVVRRDGKYSIAGYGGFLDSGSGEEWRFEAKAKDGLGTVIARGNKNYKDKATTVSAGGNRTVFTGIADIAIATDADIKVAVKQSNNGSTAYDSFQNTLCVNEIL